MLSNVSQSRRVGTMIENLRSSLRFICPRTGSEKQVGSIRGWMYNRNLKERRHTPWFWTRIPTLPYPYCTECVFFVINHGVGGREPTGAFMVETLCLLLHFFGPYKHGMLAFDETNSLSRTWWDTRNGERLCTILIADPRGDSYIWYEGEFPSLQAACLLWFFGEKKNMSFPILAALVLWIFWPRSVCSCVI
jgi:hypothetical protein